MYLALRSGQPVPTRSEKGANIHRLYFLDMAKCLDESADREEAVLSVPETLKVTSDFGRNIHLGENVFINSGCRFQDQGGIWIGSGSLIGHNVVIATLNGGTTEPGWASLIIVLCLGVGAVLFSLGVIAEYVGINVNMAMGKPLYLPVRDPQDGPLGRDRR